MWLAYYGPPKKIVVRRPSGELIEIPDAGKEQAPSGLAFIAGDESAALLWRNKQPAKGLYYLPNLPAQGDPPDPVVIDRPSEPLGRFLLEQRGSEVFTLWLGERFDPKTGRDYHLYFSRSGDGGKTWSEADLVLPGFYPAWIVTDKSIPVFSWYRDEKGERLFGVRVFDRKAGTFGEPKIIKQAPEIPHLFYGFASGNRWFLLWKGRYGERLDEPRLEGVYSDDEGKSWKEFEFKSIRGLEVSSFDLNVERDGEIYIAVSGSMPPAPGEKTKDTIYFIRSLDGGDTWSTPKIVRDQSLTSTKARFPKIAMGKNPGEVILGWVDWRNIRPMVYLSRSPDGGATWGPQVALDEKRKGSDVLSFEIDSKAIRRHGKGYSVLVERYIDDVRTAKDVLAYFVDDQRLGTAADEPQHPNRSEARLKQRVEEFWAIFLAGDYGKAYDYQDPAFRGLYSRDVYQGNMGRIKYHAFELKGIEITDNVASVQILGEASIPEFELVGKTVGRPKTAYDLTSTWLFIGDDWYREYYSEATDTKYIKY